MATSDSVPAPSLRDPGYGGGLVDVFRHRHLLKLLVRKEIRVRYQGSVLGMGWSYIKPLARFSVYFVIIGIILGMNRAIPNFAVHIVAGMALVHFFTEAFSSTTNSVWRNRSLVRKIFLPREMFPVSALLVSAVNLVPGLVILAIVAGVTGWHPTWDVVPSFLLGFAIMATWGMALGLLLSGFNVYFRDFSKVVEVIIVLIPWSTPMIYSLDLVRNAFAGRPDWMIELYLANPLVEAVMLSQQAFWSPTVDQRDDLTASEQASLEMAPHLYERGLIIVAIGLLLLWFAQKVFTRLEASFAEQL
ncbi:MAG: ABC transporter permease [Propionibacteriales bacterium]|nr:ABC transporter permease [Propionibacteriales bacterium]